MLVYRHGQVNRDADKPVKSPKKPRTRSTLITESPGDNENKSPTRIGVTAGGLFGSCWHGFPPGLTVDGLCQFRRRRPPGYLKPQDNLHPEEGTCRKYRSEYKRRFQPFTPTVTNGELSTTEQPKEISPTRYRYRPLDSFRLEYRDTAGLAPIRGIHQPHLQSSISERQAMPVAVTSEQHAKYQPFEGIHRSQLARRASSIPREKTQLMEKSSEGHAKYIHHVEAKRSELVRRPTSLSMEGELLTKTEKADKFIKYLLSKRPSIIKRSANLRLEGSMEINTEAREKFLPKEITRRQPLARRDTNLHPEGDMDMEPEYKKKYTKYESQKRPPLAKRDTNLHLEGDIELDPEYREAFVEFPIEKVTPNKPVSNLKSEGDLDVSTEMASKYVEYSLDSLKPVKIVKHLTNLQLEGNQEFNPDYRDSYKIHDLNNLRADIVKQPTNLNLEGSIEFNPDYRENYVAHTLNNLRAEIVKKAPNLNLEGLQEFSPGYRETFTQHKLKKTEMKRPENNIKSPEGRIENQSESSNQFKEHELTKRPDLIKEADKILLEGKIDMNPEYKNAFIDFPRMRPVTKKPIGEMMKSIDDIVKKKRHKGEGVHAQNGVSSFKSEGKMDSSAEYKTSYVDFPRERPVVTKPESHLKQQGQVEQPVEKQVKIVDRSPTKRESELKFDGQFECQPEYRKAYIDYITREQIDRIRPVDNLPMKENEVPGIHRKINSRDDQKTDKAFQILCTKGTEAEEKRLGPVNIKDTMNEDKMVNGHITRSPKRSILKPLQDRSPSPGYRLNVHNVDDHHVGFRIRRRRSQDIRPTSGRRKNSTCTVQSISSDRARRIISPAMSQTSPTRRKRWNASTRISRKDSARKAAFIVLADGEAAVRGVSSGRESQNNNSAIDDEKGGERRPIASRGVSKEDRTNWMPPWYDAPI